MNAITILKLGFDNLNKLVKNQFIKQGTESGLMERLGGSWKQGHAYFQALSRPWEQLHHRHEYLAMVQFLSCKQFVKDAFLHLLKLFFCLSKNS